MIYFDWNITIRINLSLLQLLQNLIDVTVFSFFNLPQMINWVIDWFGVADDPSQIKDFFLKSAVLSALCYVPFIGLSERVQTRHKGVELSNMRFSLML